MGGDAVKPLERMPSPAILPGQIKTKKLVPYMCLIKWPQWDVLGLWWRLDNRCSWFCLTCTAWMFNKHKFSLIAFAFFACVNASSARRALIVTLIFVSRWFLKMALTAGYQRIQHWHTFFLRLRQLWQRGLVIGRGGMAMKSLMQVLARRIPDITLFPASWWMCWAGCDTLLIQQGRRRGM